MRDLLALDSWRQFVRVYLRAGGRRARDVRAWLLTILNSLPMSDQIIMCLVLFEECEAYHEPSSLNSGIDLLAQASEGLLDLLGPWTRARGLPLDHRYIVREALALKKRLAKEREKA